MGLNISYGSMISAGCSLNIFSNSCENAEKRKSNNKVQKE